MDEKSPLEVKLTEEGSELCSRLAIMAPTIGVDSELKEYDLSEDYRGLTDRIRKSKKHVVIRMREEIAFRTIMRFALDFQRGVSRRYTFSSYVPESFILGRHNDRNSLLGIMQESFNNIGLISEDEFNTHLYLAHIEMCRGLHVPFNFEYYSMLDNTKIRDLILKYVKPQKYRKNGENLLLGTDSEIASLIIDFGKRCINDLGNQAYNFFSMVLEHNNILSGIYRECYKVAGKWFDICLRARTRIRSIFGTEEYRYTTSFKYSGSRKSQSKPSLAEVLAKYHLKSLNASLQPQAPRISEIAAIEYLLSYRTVSIFEARDNVYSKKRRVKVKSVDEETAIEFVRLLGYLLFDSSKTTEAKNGLIQMFGNKKLWRKLATASRDEEFDRTRGSISEEIRNIYLSEHNMRWDNIRFSTEWQNFEIPMPINAQIIDRDIASFKGLFVPIVIRELDKLATRRGYELPTFFEYIAKVKSYIIQQETFTHVQVESESLCFVNDMFDNVRLHSCAFGPNGTMSEAILGYLADDNIGLLKLVPYNRQTRLEPIAVAIIVNTKDNQSNNVWVVDSYEAGRDIRRLKWYNEKSSETVGDLRYGLIYQAILNAARDSPLKPKRIILNTKFLREEGCSVEAKEFIGYAKHRMKEEGHTNYMWTGNLYKPQNKKLNDLIGSNRLLEAWYNGRKGSEWNTGEGEVTGIEIKLAA